AAEQAITVIDAFTLETAKTKSLLQTLSTLGAADGAVIVLGERSDAVFRAARNLDRVHVVTPNGLCLLDVLKLPRLILVESAIAELTRTLVADLGPAAPGAKSSLGGGRSPTHSGDDTSGSEGVTTTPRSRRLRAAKPDEAVETSSETEEPNAESEAE